VEVPRVDSASQGHSGPATLEQVAAVAGVSRATVSRVVNASPRVNAEIVERVTAAIAELNYVPNRAARSLASRQTQALALIVPEDTTRFFGDPYLADVVRGITSRIDLSDYVLNLIVANTDPNNKTLRYLQGGNVDGAIVVSHHTSDHFLDAISQAMPVVYGGRPLKDVEQSYFVDVDNVAGARTATEHLVRLGRTRIASITGPSTMPGGIDRLAGFRAALGAAGLTEAGAIDGNFTMLDGAIAMREMLDTTPDIDAIFAASDLMAVGAIGVLRDRGYSIPADVAVVGYDDSPAAQIPDLPLTTVRQPSEQMGSMMADMMLRLLAGQPVKHANIMPTELIVRASA
jgi:DNA-binding LacI/PurR family transcriptional regulator